MEKFKEKIKNLFKNGRGAIFTLFVLHLLVTIFITPNKYDDEWFIDQIASGQSILAFAGSRYFSWTSRLLLEITECFVLRVSKYLWILIESLMVALAGYSISRLFIKKEERAQNNAMLLFMLLLYPFNSMNGSGWATTTIVYMWPLATCLFALIPIRKIWDGEKIKFWEYPLYSLALLFAANQEQTSAILLGTYILFTIFMIIKNKKIHPYMIVQTVLAIASIVFILTCPGNYVRKSQEAVRLFKDFEMYNLLDKISLGLTSTMGIIIEKRNLVYTILSLMVAVYVWTTYKEKTYRVVSIIPILTIAFLGIFQNVTNTIFPYFGSTREFVIEERVMLAASNSNSLVNVIPFLLACTNFICLGLSILLIFKNLKNNMAILVFLVGLASKIILGFSPTVFSSAERSTIFFEFAMIIVTFLIWQEFTKKTEKNDKKILKRMEVIIKIAGVLQYINVLMCVLLTTQK